MKTRKIPQRTCIGCRTVRDKRDLLRIVKTTEGELLVDETGKRNGRGAYLCRNLECLEAALTRKNLARALRCQVSDDEMEQLRQSFVELL